MPPDVAPRSRSRLSADVPERTAARIRQTARELYRGVLSDAVTAALEAFQWMVSAKAQGKRVVATDAEALPPAFEEPVIAGLDGFGRDWTWLVQRDHPWRRQLWVKGRRIPAGQLARTAGVEGWTPEEAAAQFDLPVEAVVEALRYAEMARELIAAEEAEDRIAAAGYETSGAPVPG